MARVRQEIPKIGLVMEQVRIAHWLKAVGDEVTRGEPIVEVESEKSVVEIEAEVSGTLIEIVLDVDVEATVGDLIAWIESDQLPETEGESEAADDARTVQPAAPNPAPSAVPEPRLRPANADTTRIPSSPAARRFARENGIDLSGVSGTGPGGRIQLSDVESAASVDDAGAAGLSPMRRALARSMTLSNATVPQFVVERSVDWAAVEMQRSQLNTELGPADIKLSVNDYLLQAIADALIAFPAANAVFDGDASTSRAKIVTATGAHIGLVVAVDDGLIVPVLHDLQDLSIKQIAQLRAGAVERGLSGKLKADELGGATISISNLGRQGPDRFTAIVNPPQSAILAVGRPRDVVVLHNGEIAVRHQSTLSLTVDHRLIDGRLASDFLARVVEVLEHPNAGG